MPNILSSIICINRLKKENQFYTLKKGAFF